MIIPTYSHFEYARAAVRSLVRNGPRRGSAEYLVVDDHSPEWDSVDWRSWPHPECRKIRFASRGGLTRSWNAGLRAAVAMRAEYAVCTNSDVLFSPGWFEPLAEALEGGFRLVGPVSNAPGHTGRQDVRRYLPEPVAVSDSARSLRAVARALRRERAAPVASWINGFFLMARTETWREGAYSRRCVFDPGFRMAGNEDELQTRWWERGWTMGFAPASYVFHYRSVSRPEGLRIRSAAGAYRPGIGRLNVLSSRG